MQNLVRKADTPPGNTDSSRSGPNPSSSRGLGLDFRVFNLMEKEDISDAEIDALISDILEEDRTSQPKQE